MHTGRSDASGQLLPSAGKRRERARPTHPPALWAGKATTTAPALVRAMVGGKPLRATPEGKEHHLEVGRFFAGGAGGFPACAGYNGHFGSHEQRR